MQNFNSNPTIPFLLKKKKKKWVETDDDILHILWIVGKSFVAHKFHQILHLSIQIFNHNPTIPFYLKMGGNWQWYYTHILWIVGKSSDLPHLERKHDHNVTHL